MKTKSLLTALLILTFYLMSKDEVMPETSRLEKDRTMIHVVTLMEPIIIQEVHDKVSAVARIPVDNNLSSLSELEKEELEGLPRGMSYLPSVRALTKSEYQPKDGKIILQKNGLIYFFSNQGQGRSVVYDQRRDTLHPITETIKLSKIDLKQRQKNIYDGWNEFSYNSELKIQYLQSSADQLINHYQDLKESGFHPSLEVVTQVHVLK